MHILDSCPFIIKKPLLFAFIFFISIAALAQQKIKAIDFGVGLGRVHFRDQLVSALSQSGTPVMFSGGYTIQDNKVIKKLNLNYFSAKTHSNIDNAYTYYAGSILWAQLYKVSHSDKKIQLWVGGQWKNQINYQSPYSSPQWSNLLNSSVNMFSSLDAIGAINYLLGPKSELTFQLSESLLGYVLRPGYVDNLPLRHKISFVTETLSHLAELKYKCFLSAGTTLQLSYSSTFFNTSFPKSSKHLHNYFSATMAFKINHP